MRKELSAAKRMEDNTAQRIADAVLSGFDSIKSKSGKPVVRSNGQKEWTILASVVLISDNLVAPVTIATGVKVLPDAVRQYSGGRMVCDMHAEMLALRAFNWFITRCCRHSEYFEEAGPKFKLRDEYKVALFITEPPCGDASMGYIAEQSASAEPWEPEKKRQKTARGRGHFDKLGIVRTKPGRADSIETLTKSCSDKLCLKQLVGINNSITSTFCEPIYLDYLVLHRSKFQNGDIERCFHKRFSQAVKPVQILAYDRDEYQFHKGKDTVPSPLSLVHVVPEKTTQVLNAGVRNGCSLKKRPPKNGGESIFCNYKLYKDSCDMVEYGQKTYVEFKRSLVERNRDKQRAKTGLGGWTDTTKDDFTLD